MSRQEEMSSSNEHNALLNATVLDVLPEEHQTVPIVFHQVPARSKKFVSTNARSKKS